MKIHGSEITPYKIYLNRRKFIKSALILPLGLSWTKNLNAKHREVQNNFTKYLDKNDKLNTYEEITTYNNFYEFGSGKSDPFKFSKQFITKPWTIKVDGLVEKPGVINIEDLLKNITIEDRIYRLRCVEAWSMVIPWQGFSLSKLIEKVKPLSNAKFIQFVTIFRPEQMPGQKRNILPWPYVEGLRMDEAMNPLTILSTGLYGHDLLNQNGAPIRLVVPWKYGFKSIKSIVHIKFVENQPKTTWSSVAPNEYGFYSNVNNNVNHPRWSQEKERRIGEFKRRKTLMFNGYEEEVSHMYNDMDLKLFF